MVKPVLTSFNQIAELTIQKYERYLPTAFDESLSLVEKMNMIIEYLNKIGKVSNDVVAKWNEVMAWIMGDGLNDAVRTELDEMVVDGTLATIINEILFEELNRKIGDLAVNVKNYGAKGDGVTDDTNAIKTALTENANVHFPKGDYVISSSIVFNSHTITADKGTRILKNFGGVGVFVVGGVLTTTITNLSVDGFGSFAANTGTATTQHGIVVIGNRVNWLNVNANSHRGNGIVFLAEQPADTEYSGLVPATSCNMNRSRLEYVGAQVNDGKGIVFEGTRDDIAVFNMSLYTYGNRENGIFFADNSMFRHGDGTLYSESDGRLNRTTDHSIYFGKVRNSQFHVYSEGLSNLNAQEIYINVNCENLTVFSDRNNRDLNMTSTTAVFPSFIRKLSYEYKVQKRGTTGAQAENINFPIKQVDLSPLSNNASWFTDLNYFENGTHKLFERVYGSGNKTEYAIDKGTDVAHKTAKTMNGEIDYVIGATKKEFSYVAKGTLTTPTDLAVGDVIKSEEIRGYLGGDYRNCGKIDYVVSQISGNSFGIDLVFYTKDSANFGTYTETLRMNYLGQVIIPKLAGVGDRPLLVDSNGRLKV